MEIRKQSQRFRIDRLEKRIAPTITTVQVNGGGTMNESAASPTH